MCEVASVENQIRLPDGCIDLVHRHLQGAGNIDVCRCVDADVTVADLNERKVGGFSLVVGSAE